MARMRRIKKPWVGLIVLILLLGVVGFAVLQHVLSIEGKGLIRFTEELREVNFEGTYRVKAPGYEATLDIVRAGKGYTLKWTFDDGRVYYGNGIQMNDLLGAVYDMGNDKTCGVVIYQKQEKELSGLWAIVNDDKLFSERTLAAYKLKAGEHDLSGTYEFKGQNPNSTEYQGTLTLKRTGANYEAEWVLADERPVYGTFFAVGDIAVAGYQDQMGIRVAVYEIKRDGLEGRWLYTAFDRLPNISDLRPGTEKAKK